MQLTLKRLMLLLSALCFVGAFSQILALEIVMLLVPLVVCLFAAYATDNRIEWIAFVGVALAIVTAIIVIFPYVG